MANQKAVPLLNVPAQCPGSSAGQIRLCVGIRADRHKVIDVIALGVGEVRVGNFVESSDIHLSNMNVYCFIRSQKVPVFISDAFYKMSIEAIACISRKSVNHLNAFFVRFF
ncbi:hypothetical protein SDC9_124562 [bioreactor metagenome]|uniref:Uncharacterized protein n=1 Tax=bioreactor metagenome TaxID=1076179 RepID=A0A645CKR9_9ZZZZ